MRLAEYKQHSVVFLEMISVHEAGRAFEGGVGKLSVDGAARGSADRNKVWIRSDTRRWCEGKQDARQKSRWECAEWDRWNRHGAS